MLCKSDTGRQTGNRAWAHTPRGPLSGEAHSLGVELKVAASKNGVDFGRLVAIGNNLIALAGRIEGLENATLRDRTRR